MDVYTWLSLIFSVVLRTFGMYVKIWAVVARCVTIQYHDKLRWNKMAMSVVLEGCVPFVLFGTTISGNDVGTTVTLDVVAVVVLIEDSDIGIFISDRVGRTTDCVFRNAYPVVDVTVGRLSMLCESTAAG